MPSTIKRPTAEEDFDLIVTGSKTQIDLTTSNDDTLTMHTRAKAAAAKGRDGVRAVANKANKDKDNADYADSEGSESGNDAPGTKSKGRGSNASATGQAPSKKRGRPAKEAGGTAKQTRKRKRKVMSYDEYCGKIDDLEATAKKLRADKTAKDDKLSDLRAAHNALKRRAETTETDLKEQLTRCHASLEKKENAISGMQAELLDAMGKGSIPAAPDNEVKDDLSRLMRHVKLWANTWAPESWEHVPRESLADRGKCSRHRRVASNRAMEAISKGKIPPKVVVNALASSILFYETIMHPLSFLRSDEDGYYDAAAKDKFGWILDLARQDSVEAFVNLRMTLVKLITREKRQQDGTAIAKTASVQCLISAHCSNTAICTLTTCASYLRSVNATEKKVRNEELRKIVHEAFQQGIVHASQLVLTLPVLLPSLKREKFAGKHEFLIPHRALKLKEHDDDDNCPTAEEAGIAGREVDLIVEPAIQRQGDSDGQGYDNPRILIKAVVWMVKDEDLEASRAVAGPQAHKDEVPLTFPTQPLNDAPPAKEALDESMCHSNGGSLPVVPLDETDATSRAEDQTQQAEQEASEPSVPSSTQQHEKGKEETSEDVSASAGEAIGTGNGEDHTADTGEVAAALPELGEEQPEYVTFEGQPAAESADAVTTDVQKPASQGTKRTCSESALPNKRPRISLPPSNEPPARRGSMNILSAQDIATDIIKGDAHRTGTEQDDAMPVVPRTTMTSPKDTQTSVSLYVKTVVFNDNIKRESESPDRISIKRRTMTDIENGLVDRAIKDEH